MVCIAHVGTRNVSVDRLTPSELGDTTTFIQEKKVAAGKNRPPPQMSLRMVLWVAASLAPPPLPGPPGDYVCGHDKCSNSTLLGVAR